MNQEKLKELWKDEENYAFKGWDFSHITGRCQSEPLPWDYKEMVKSYMSSSKIMLDMGTGGSEFLLTLDPPKGRTYATESYLPNIELSKQVLTPHGIEVRAIEDDAELPFEDDFFDLIIDRHESYCLQEVDRILKPGGIFITQQVGEKNNRELSKFLLGEYPVMECIPPNLAEAVETAKSLGWKVTLQKEYFPATRYYDIGALVFFVKIISWEFPDFSVERCFDRLLMLQKRLEEQGYIESIEHRYILMAHK